MLAVWIHPLVPCCAGCEWEFRSRQTRGHSHARSVARERVDGACHQRSKIHHAQDPAETLTVIRLDLRNAACTAGGTGGYQDSQSKKREPVKAAPFLPCLCPPRFRNRVAGSQVEVWYLE